MQQTQTISQLIITSLEADTPTAVLSQTVNTSSLHTGCRRILELVNTHISAVIPMRDLVRFGFYVQVYGLKGVTAPFPIGSFVVDCSVPTAVMKLNDQCVYVICQSLGGGSRSFQLPQNAKINLSLLSRDGKTVPKGTVQATIEIKVSYMKG